MAVPRKAPGLRFKAPGLRSSVLRFVASLAAAVGLATLVALTNSSALREIWFVLLVSAALPVTVVCLIDIGRALRAMPNPSRLVWFLGIALGIPEVFFLVVPGVVSLACGLAMVFWVVYNSYVHRLPAYTGTDGLQAIVMGSLMIVWGFWLLRR
jgi:hypothetical protein